MDFFLRKLLKADLFLGPKATKVIKLSCTTDFKIIQLSSIMRLILANKTIFIMRKYEGNYVRQKWTNVIYFPDILFFRSLLV